MFAMTGLSVSWFMLLLMFAPYAILAYFMHRFDYFKPKSGIIRGVVVAAFFNMTMGFVYLVATRVVTIGIDIPIDEWVRALGGYWVLALVGTLVLVPLDFIFSTLSIYVLKRIPDPDGGSRRPPPADKKADADKKPATADTSDESNEQENRSGGGETEKKYDIFGYEITDDGDDKDAKR